MSEKVFPFEEGVRRIRVRQLFVARYPNRATTNEVFAFFTWLAWLYPHLVPNEKQGDPYQLLKSDLHDLYKR